MRNQRGYMADWMIGVLLLTASGVIAGGLFLTSYILSAVSCEKKAKMMGLPSDYGWWTGCMVQVGERYAPISYIRIVDNKVIIQGDGEE